MTRRVIVGAHYGSGSWLAQRLTALYMAVYSLVLAVALLGGEPITYPAWQDMFAAGWMRVATLIFVVSLAWHAWVGARDILMDYVKPDGLRLGLEAATLLLLAVYLGWAAEILWR